MRRLTSSRTVQEADPVIAHKPGVDALGIDDAVVDRLEQAFLGSRDAFLGRQIRQIPAHRIAGELQADVGKSGRQGVFPDGDARLFGGGLDGRLAQRVVMAAALAATVTDSAPAAVDRARGASRIADAFVAAERRVDARIANRLDSELGNRPDALLTEDAGGFVTRFVWQRQFEVGQNPADRNRLLDRPEILQDLVPDRGILANVAPHRVTRLRRRRERYFAGALRDKATVRPDWRLSCISGQRFINAVDLLVWDAGKRVVGPGLQVDAIQFGCSARPPDRRKRVWFRLAGSRRAYPADRAALPSSRRWRSRLFPRPAATARRSLTMPRGDGRDGLPTGAATSRSAPPAPSIRPEKAR